MLSREAPGSAPEVTDARWEGSRRPSFKEKESEIEIWVITLRRHHIW